MDIKTLVKIDTGPHRDLQAVAHKFETIRLESDFRSSLEVIARLANIEADLQVLIHYLYGGRSLEFEAAYLLIRIQAFSASYRMYKGRKEDGDEALVAHLQANPILLCDYRNLKDRK